MNIYTEPCFTGAVSTTYIHKVYFSHQTVDKHKVPTTKTLTTPQSRQKACEKNVNRVTFQIECKQWWTLSLCPVS